MRVRTTDGVGTEKVANVLLQNAPGNAEAWYPEAVGRERHDRTGPGRE